MKTLPNLIMILVLLPIITACNMQNEKPGTTSYTYAVEMDGVTCGYSQINITPQNIDGNEILLLDGNVHVMMSVMNAGFDLNINYLYHLDPETKLHHFSQLQMAFGKRLIDQTAIIKDDTIIFTSSMLDKTKKIPVTADVIPESPIYYHHLLNNFEEGDVSEQNFKIFDDMTGMVVDKSVNLIQPESLILDGKIYNTLVFDEINLTTGVKSKIWVDKETGIGVKYEVANRKIYLANKSVIKGLKIANLDNLLFINVNQKISDIRHLSFMKVRAVIKSQGEWITAENLNSKGQQFSGTVEDNRIEGVFTIEKKRYNGTSAMSFPPPDLSQNKELYKYLAPENLIESDHPKLVKKARKITDGSWNSWEAAVRLSRWVDENIEGAIPGGTSAINTYNTSEGECGSHSRLLIAFCRAIGIPARLSTGCMFTNYHGGSFGQHAWTEVYMGEAGWIAVDATAQEVDYIDAGHIRLGEQTSFNPVEMEILEYRTGIDNNSYSQIMLEEFNF